MLHCFRFRAWLISILCLGFVVGSGCRSVPADNSRSNPLADTLRQSLHEDVLNHWYPRVIDSTGGGYLSHFAHDWARLEPQNKFVVLQGRHVWTASEMHGTAPRDDSLYLRAAQHGVRFLKETMWDETHGGFHSLTDREGTVETEGGGFTGRKTAYGTAFAIYGLANHYDATGDTSALRLAQRAFQWLDEHAHDSVHGGYFQPLRPDGTPYVDGTDDGTPPKDQNSTIHLLEAFTALYETAPDTPGLRERLDELLTITRDTMTMDRGTLHLFFERDWTPISYRDSARSVREEHYNRDHVSFGHDVETAFLMLEAAEALGHDPVPTLTVGKRMVDHALTHGWDAAEGGLYDGGFIEGPDSVRIVRSTKTWWAQAEALYTLFLMANRFPDDAREYEAKARQTWRYIDRFLVDKENGGWFVRGLDESPDARTEPKATIWKGNYHNTRALLKSAELLERE